MPVTKSSIHSEETLYLSKVLSAIAHPARLAILYYLKEHGTCKVNQITLELSQSTISGHLKILKGVSLISATQDGICVYYYINEIIWDAFKDVLNDLANQFVDN